MSTWFTFPVILTAVTFGCATALFLVTGAMRRRLDAILVEARGLSGDRTAGHQLGLFERWNPENPSILATPERRWTYDQAYLIEFLGILHVASQSVPQRQRWLTFYRRDILGLDIVFALSFSAFIALASALVAAHPGILPWVGRAASTTAALGILYGLSDGLEDVVLKRILQHAEDEYTLRSRQSRAEEVAVADAAQVDAANTLTRLKLITLTASVIGLVAFLILFALDVLIGKMGGPRSSDRITPQATGQ